MSAVGIFGISSESFESMLNNIHFDDDIKNNVIMRT